MKTQSIPYKGQEIIELTIYPHKFYHPLIQ